MLRNKRVDSVILFSFKFHTSISEVLIIQTLVPMILSEHGFIIHNKIYSYHSRHGKTE